MPDIMVPPEAGEARPTFGIGIRKTVNEDRNLVTKDETSPVRNKLLNVNAFDKYQKFLTGRVAQPNNKQQIEIQSDRDIVGSLLYNLPKYPLET